MGVPLISCPDPRERDSPLEENERLPTEERKPCPGSATQGYISRGWRRVGLVVVQAHVSRGRAPGFMNTGVFAHGAPIYAACATRIHAPGRVCRCLVTRQQSPWGLNTVCTSVVRELDPTWARTSYQLIFHERAVGYVPGLTTTLRNLWKLVIHGRHFDAGDRDGSLFWRTSQRHRTD